MFLRKGIIPDLSKQCETKVFEDNPALWRCDLFVPEVHYTYCPCYSASVKEAAQENPLILGEC
jgi:hypothetical protein